MKRIPIKIRRRKDGFEMYGKLPKPGEIYSFALAVDGNRVQIRNFVREKSTNQTKT